MGKIRTAMVYCDFILYFVNKNEALKIRLSGYNPDDDIEDWEEDDEWDDEHYEDDLDETRDNGEYDDFNSEGDWQEDAWSEEDLN